jgi:mannose-6-phosphate isomerase-like protein (cupin superfamily)
MNGDVYALAEALATSPSPGNLAAEIVQLPGLDVEFYQPKGEDRQTPHERDEIYVVARGSGVFEVSGKQRAFETGDLIYVAAHTVHRFVEFSGDFAAWVLFWP